MPAYLIADVHVKDPKKYDEYRTQVAPTVARHGGRFIVRGGRHELLEGQRDLQRLVVIEFPSMDALKAWYGSPEYQPLIALRQAASTGDLIAVEGV
jgi:uncharacterized protein (DUF1330 family)